MFLNEVTILTAAGWAVVTAVLAAQRGGDQIRFRDFAFGGAIAAGMAGAVAVVWTESVFGLFHFAYVTATAGPAFLAAIIGFAMVRGGFGVTRGTAVLAVGLLVPPSVGIWATHIAPFSVETERVTLELPCGRSGDDDIVIGVLADIQTPRITEHELSVRDRIMAENPDLIVIAGDMQQGSSLRDEIDGFRAFFAGLHAPHGVFLADGDVDSVEDAQRMIEGSSVQLLVNDIVMLEVGDRRIALGANELEWDADGAVRMLSELADVADDTVSIVLTHRPDVAIGMGGAADLVIAGHTHGGQIVIPGIGPLSIASGIPRSIGAGGLHDLDGQAIYVSSGVGMERSEAPQVRLFAPPSFGVLTLTMGSGCA